MDDGIYEIKDRSIINVGETKVYQIHFRDDNTSFDYTLSTEFDNLRETGFKKAKKLAERNTHVVIRGNDIIAFAEMIQ